MNGMVSRLSSLWCSLLGTAATICTPSQTSSQRSIFRVSRSSRISCDSSGSRISTLMGCRLSPSLRRPGLARGGMRQMNDGPRRALPQGKRQGKHLAGEACKPRRFRSPDRMQLAFLQLVEFQRPRIAVDDEPLTGTDLGIEVELSAGLIAGTDDFHGEIGAAHPVRAAIPGRIRLQNNEEIGNPIVILPSAHAVADICRGLNAIAAIPIDHGDERNTQGHHERLMFVIGHGRHDMHSFPDLVPAVDFPRLAIVADFLRQFRIENQHAHGMPPFSEFTPSRSGPWWYASNERRAAASASAGQTSREAPCWRGLQTAAIPIARPNAACLSSTGRVPATTDRGRR